MNLLPDTVLQAMSRLLTQSGPCEAPCLGDLKKRQEVCGDRISAKMAIEGLRNMTRLFPSPHAITKSLELRGAVCSM